jgi:putative nucleotidyltransferase with HDIG domain
LPAISTQQNDASPLKPSAATENWRALVHGLDALPVMPAVLGPLIRYLELPPDQIEIEKVTEFVARDSSMAAQCLRAANSALFSRSRSIESLRGAIVALGSTRLRGLIWTSFLHRLTAKNHGPINASAFWKHSFACALWSQRVSELLGLPDAQKAYLCGLLHDVGEIVNSAILPNEFRSVLEEAGRTHEPLVEIESRSMGFTHAEAGRTLADRWSLPTEVTQAIEFHHRPEQCNGNAAMVAVVNLSDVLCRTNGLGYGYEEHCGVGFSDAPGWKVLKQSMPRALEQLDVAGFGDQVTAEIPEIELMVSSVFGL